MPTYVVVARMGQCVRCGASWVMMDPHAHTKACPQCFYLDWEWGEDSVESKRIRMGLATASTSLNPGAKSLKRRERARKSGGRLKPKSVDGKKK